MLGKMKKLDKVFARACFRWINEGTMPERLYESEMEAEVACGHCFAQRTGCIYKLEDRPVKEMFSLDEIGKLVEAKVQALDEIMRTNSDDGQTELPLDAGNEPEPSATE